MSHRVFHVLTLTYLQAAKTYGDPFEYPDDFPGWPEGTVPVTEPF